MSSRKCLQLTCKLDTHNMAVRNGSAGGSRGPPCENVILDRAFTGDFGISPAGGPLQRAVPARKNWQATARAHPECFRERMPERSEIVRRALTDKRPK